MPSLAIFHGRACSRLQSSILAIYLLAVYDSFITYDLGFPELEVFENPFLWVRNKFMAPCFFLSFLYLLENREDLSGLFS